MKRMTMSAVLAGAAVFALMPAGSARAATWGGGTGDWISDNWGLNSPDGSPGDANHHTEAATINSGTVNINAGDSISLTASPGLITLNAAGVTVNQDGGSLTNSVRTTVYGQYHLSGGLLDGTDFRMSRGGVYSVSGNGHFGTRLAGGPDSIIQFNGYGDGMLDITGGIIDVHTVDMSHLFTGGGYATQDSLVKVTGTAATVQTLYWYLNSGTGGTSATADFVFSASGISGWSVGSNNGLNLGTGANRGLLSVDVNAFTSDGTTGFSLIDYRQAIQGDGTFGGISILDSHYAGGLTLGTKGSLLPGQYYLDMADNTVGDGTMIALYFNNTVPEPGALGLVLLGGMGLMTRRRKARMG
jgi:hypothetical protein